MRLLAKEEQYCMVGAASLLFFSWKLNYRFVGPTSVWQSANGSLPFVACNLARNRDLATAQAAVFRIYRHDVMK